MLDSFEINIGEVALLNVVPLRFSGIETGHVLPFIISVHIIAALTTIRSLVARDCQRCLSHVILTATCRFSLITNASTLVMD